MSDLISRSALIEEIDYYISHTNDTNSEHYAYKRAKELIERQPTVEAKPVVKGEWERIPYSFAGGYKCSCCGRKSVERHWNFCPKCGAIMNGADMRGGKNET